MTKQIAREFRDYLIFAGGTALSAVILGNLLGFLHWLATTGHTRWMLLIVGLLALGGFTCLSVVVVGGRSER